MSCSLRQESHRGLKGASCVPSYMGHNLQEDKWAKEPEGECVYVDPCIHVSVVSVVKHHRVDCPHHLEVQSPMV